MNPEEKFPFEAKRALVQLLRGPVVTHDADRQQWSAILAHRTEIERRLADVFLTLVLDEDDGIAFTRPQPTPDDPKLAPPQVLRTETLTFMDTLVLLTLRYQLLVASPGQRVIVEYDDVAADMDPYRGRYTTDDAGFRKRINALREKMKNYSLAPPQTPRADSRCHRYFDSCSTPTRLPSSRPNTAAFSRTTKSCGTGTRMGEDLLRHGQHRLARVQLFNWGTYDGYHDLPIARLGFLITGPSGSGKSTLLDAISSVLVPPTKLSFNAAAQGRGRTVASYIRGAYARGSDTETRELRARYLREGATWSAVGLTMTTAGPGDDDTVTTLVALFHLKRGSNDLGESGRAFLLFDNHLDITELRHVVTDGINVRELKKRWPDVLYNKSYPQFGQRLRARLGIADENAQLLLHRAMSAKGLDSLDRLFRDYMLDEPETFAEARRAVEFFADLDEAHRRVVQTREQITALTPLEEFTTTRDLADRDTRELGEEQAGLDGLAASFELDLARGWHTDADAAHGSQRLRQRTDPRCSSRRRCGSKYAERSRDGNQSLCELTDALDHAGERVERVVTQRNRLNSALLPWGATAPDTADDFATAQSQIAREAAELANNVAEHDAAYGALMLAAARAEENVAELKRQIAAIAGQKLNIDYKLLVARELIVRSTGLPARSLPFAGELIDVTDPAWAGAAERVLGGLGRTLLVATEHADDVAAAVDAAHLGTPTGVAAG